MKCPRCGNEMIQEGEWDYYCPNCLLEIRGD